MRIGVVTFPGSLDDRDALRAVRIAGGTPVPLWHGDEDIKNVDAVVLPGGFSYGDYLRCGAIARFAPVMRTVTKLAGPPTQTSPGLPVLGICNGFQVLTESHLLPGALVRNEKQQFVCRDQKLRIERTSTSWTNGYGRNDEIVIPLKNGEGGFIADEATLDALEGEGQIVARYLDGNPNGSRRDIAGISNVSGTVVGLMPHPEHATEALYGPENGGTDGLAFFTSALQGVLSA
ncbi:phosphoribosylformylglycinamidine synthase subunit PurQ [Kineosporia sp. J2-2]|uniref:Phosphoribosylformylglycinamidine synthase subunit PurQ n=1 Tax=Kineosporia corallincola TaxID=2835133 RepID=A0ABS5TNL1_9ACTN|nr:phosphoribosylformylglycinamidine synthase subunit PurQ [Kineosporia corallincola]MBT0772695.1 phosphoribosylformylglycinamidine synthase subunit PurQ [Kineosporia corallincola]